MNKQEFVDVIEKNDLEDIWRDFAQELFSGSRWLKGKAYLALKELGYEWEEV